MFTSLYIFVYIYKYIHRRTHICVYTHTGGYRYRHRIHIGTCLWVLASVYTCVNRGADIGIGICVLHMQVHVCESKNMHKDTCKAMYLPRRQSACSLSSSAYSPSSRPPDMAEAHQAGHQAQRLHVALWYIHDSKVMIW